MDSTVLQESRWRNKLFVCKFWPPHRYSKTTSNANGKMSVIFIIVEGNFPGNYSYSIWTVPLRPRYRENLNYRDPTPSNLTTKKKRQRNKFHKIFNRTSLKLSYSCMPNIKTKTNANNREILRNTPSKNANHCNCQQKKTLPDERCLYQIKFSLLCYHKLQR